MYQSGTSPTIKKTVRNALSKGVNVKGLYQIISYGPPSDLNLTHTNWEEQLEMVFSLKCLYFNSLTTRVA